MGQTIIEKIIQNHSKEKVRPGEIVWMDLDVRSARDFGGANVVKHFNKEYPGEKIADTQKTIFTFDCVAPAVTIAYANNQHICRQFAREQNIRVFDVDSGIGSHIMIEDGYALPGMTIVGTDSHLNIVGAVGAFGQGMGDQDIAFSFKTGKTWFEVPETIKIILKGKFNYPTTAKDLTLFIVGKLGSKGALGKAIEFYGDSIDVLDLDGRITLASMATEMGAIASLIPPSKEIIDFCQNVTIGEKEFQTIYADSDANYCSVLEIDVSNLEPQISVPSKPDNVHPVKNYGDKIIHSVFIGSCTNGRFGDFSVAAELLKGRRIKKEVMAKIVPATRKVYKKLLDEGLIEIFFNAGFIISHPSCAGCASGQIGMTGKGEVQISTSNRNFVGKQGDGETFLASPLTAVASALIGRITSPEEVL